MILGYRVRERRERLNLSQAELAKRVAELGGKLSQTQVSTLENSGTPGAKRVERPRYLPELATALLTTTDYLEKEDAQHIESYAREAAKNVDTESSSGSNPQRGPMSGDARLLGAMPLLGENDLPVYAASDVGGGIMLLSAKPKDKEARPQFVASVPDAFGVYVATDVMSPAYNRGDRVVVNPAKPPRDGDDVILLDKEISQGPAQSAIRRLLSRTETHWVCQQFNPEKRERMAQTDWPICHKIESVRRR